MKRLLYMVVLVGLLSACNNSTSTTSAENQTATPGGQSGSTATTENQAGLLTNPEHGKPGHNCALPVGAPLNQKVTAPQTTPTASATNTAQPVAAKPSANQKINPAHGQPGHDCAKPVGAPLS